MKALPTFTPNGLLVSHHQGTNTYFQVQYKICELAERPALVWISGFGWAQKEITQSEFIELKGEMVIPEDGLANNGFFNFKN
jgi:hypothetical protein